MAVCFCPALALARCEVSCSYMTLSLSNANESVERYNCDICMHAPSDVFEGSASKTIKATLTAWAFRIRCMIREPYH